MEDKVRIPLWLQFLLLFSSIFLLMKKIIGARRRSNESLPQGPPKLPIIGNLHQFGALPYRSLHRLSKKHGPLMLLQLGTVPTLVVSSAKTAKQVLKTNDFECCSRPLLAATGRLSYNYLDVAFCPYGNYWTEMRKIFALKLFSVNRVQSFRFIREEEVAAMITSISQSSFSRNPVNVSKMLMSLTMEITCRVTFGKSFADQGKFDVHKFQGLVEEATEIMGSFSASDFFPCVGWIIDRITGFHGRLERIFHDLDIFFQKAIDDRLLLLGRPKQEDHEDILDVLLRLQEDQTQSSAIQITHDHIKAIFMNIFMAGVGTTASVMEWVMAELAKNPRVMKKAQQEIRNYFGRNGKISESDIDQLQYLKSVVKEALRLHPTGPLLIPRESLSEFNINGYNVTSKTRIYVNAWAIGRDPESWENPEQFFPERFIIDSPIDIRGKHFEFLPFGAGRRMCPGMYMGMFTVESALANLLYHFDWKLANGMKEEDLNMEEAIGLTSHKKEDVLLLPTKYENRL